MSAPRPAPGHRPGRRRIPRSQRMPIVHGILAIVVVVIVLQVWLLTATMNAYLGGEETLLLPAAIASLVCFVLNAGLLWYLYGLDR